MRHEEEAEEAITHYLQIIQFEGKREKPVENKIYICMYTEEPSERESV